MTREVGYACERVCLIVLIHKDINNTKMATVASVALFRRCFTRIYGSDATMVMVRLISM